MTEERWPNVVLLLPGTERHVFDAVTGVCAFVKPNDERCDQDHRRPWAPPGAPEIVNAKLGGVPMKRKVSK
jgi:hypothetical protein